MRNLPVHWFEGLFLRPQHFQASDRYWEELMHTGMRWDHPYNYGIHAIEFSKEALANHRFEVSTLEVRMRDGTLVLLGDGEKPSEADLRPPKDGDGRPATELKSAFEQESVVQVFLAVPKLNVGRGNVARGANSGDTRFTEVKLAVQDESHGGDDQELQFRLLNARILLSTQDTSGYELLPIAQVKRVNEAEASPHLDDDYIPPVLSIDAWPQLGRDIVRSIYDLIGQKIEVLSQQVMSRAIGLESRNPGDLERILMLLRLNTSYTTLGVLAFARGIHPIVVYTEMCRIAGDLSLFNPDHRAVAVPPYDHDDLGRIFKEIRSRIERLLNAVRDYEYEMRFFEGVGLGMQVSLEPQWFHSDWQWFIGVNKGELTESECRELLSPGQLDWKFGSGRQVEMLFKHRAEGLQLRPLNRAIGALPSRADWLYYEVSSRDGSAWNDVQETQSLALRLKDSLIVNHDRLQGERQLVVLSAGHKATLQFALFAVPMPS